MNQAKAAWANRLKQLLFYGALIVGTAPATMRNITGNDFWKALYSGRYLAMFHRFPHHSTFTYSPVEDFLVRNAFNWLGNLTFLGGYLIGGEVGFQLFRLLVVLGVVVLLHSLVDYDPNPVYLVLFVLFVLGVSQKLILRTAFFSLPLTVLLFWFWHQIRYNNRINWIYAIPVILLVWSNLHGSYIMGWGLFALLVVGTILDKAVLKKDDITPSFLLRITLVLVLVVPLVTFVKPFPETKLVDQFTSAGSRILALSSLTSTADSSTEPEVQESENPNEPWLTSVKSLLQTSLFGEQSFRSSEFNFPPERTHLIFVKAAFVLVVPVLLVLVLARPVEITEWLLILAGMFFTFSYLRTVAYFPLVALPVLLRRSRDRQFYSRLKQPLSLLCCLLLFSAWVGVSTALVASGSLSTLSGNSYHEFGIGTPARHHSKVPQQVRANYPDRRVANSYNIGSYLVWRWWPHKKVLVDTKGSTYADQFIEDLATESFQRNLIDEGITLYLTETSNLSGVRALEASDLWDLRLHDSRMALFEYVGDPKPDPSEKDFRFKLL